MTDATPAPEAPAESPAAPAALPSPGRLIRRARENASQTLEDLAGQIKLSKTTLDALERDDFAQLGQPVYVRGYYRKCAKVLPVAEAELIAAYEAQVKPAVPTTPKRIPLAGGVSSGTTPGQARSVLGWVVAAGVVVGGMFWVSHQQMPSLPSLEPAASAPAATPAAAETVAPAATGKAPLAPVVTDAAEARPAPVAMPAPVAPVVPRNQLVLQFADASWVRVEDGRNKTLLIGLVRAGEKQVLDGQPPYTVFFGNARKIKLEFDGRPFDFSAQIQPNDTARFTVP